MGSPIFAFPCKFRRLDFGVEGVLDLLCELTPCMLTVVPPACPEDEDDFVGDISNEVDVDVDMIDLDIVDNDDLLVDAGTNASGMATTISKFSCA
jgi:hypothetical protein